MDKFDEIIEEVKAKLNKKGCHDWEHVERVYALAMHIGEREKANLNILRYAALLHDIGREEEMISKGKICHAQIGAVIAREMLEKRNFKEDFITKVVHCIESHRSFKGNEPESIEAKVLFDADKLDSIGAIGIARTFQFSGEIGSKTHNKEADLRPEAEYSIEDTGYREFLLKGNTIKERMMTQTGKILAKARHEFMLNFFERLNEEVDGIL